MNMSAAKKRKINGEGRVFSSEWCTKFIVVPHNQGVFCPVCQITITAMKEYRIKRHYITPPNLIKLLVRHEWTKLNIWKNPFKNKVFLPLTRKIQNRWQNWDLGFVNVWQKKESLSVTENLLKIVWQYSQNIHARRKNIWLKKLAFPALLPYAGQMIFQIISEILKMGLKSCESFNLALDEGTDISDTAQLVIFIRAVTADFDTIYQPLRSGRIWHKVNF